MIQRIQTLWLVLAIIFAVLSFNLPFYSGMRADKDGVLQSVNLNAGQEILLLLLTGLVILLAVITIFLFKDRKKQLTLTIINIIFSLVLLTLYFMEIQKFTSGTVALWCLLTIAIPVFLVFAAIGIRKDEKLIKSLDRLR